MVNIFIGISQNQINNYKLLLPRLKNDTNILISGSSSYDGGEHFTKVYVAEKELSNTSVGKINAIKNIIEKIKSYKKIIKALAPYRETNEVTLYFTYIEDILTNYLLFSFNKKVKGIVVEDGVLNYYNHTIRSLDKKKVWLKKILSDLYGVPFTLYKGHSSGIEYEHVIKQFVREPQYSLFPEKSEKLIPPQQNPTLTDTILIIGQEAYINMYGFKKYMDSLDELLNLVKQSKEYNKVKVVYYKPHRNGPRLDKKIFREKFLEKEIVFLEAEKPLEDLFFHEIGSRWIYSFDSSALINIYLDTCVEIQKEIKFNILLRFNKQLKPIFKKLNFKITE